MALPAFFYTPQVPLGPQQKNVSQPIMEANFQAINELINEDHVGFNQNNVGFHDKVTLVTQPAPPNFSGFSGLFSATNSTTGKLDTFVAAFTQAGLPVFPLTASILSTVAAPAANSSGWTYLPSGIIFKWGANQAANGNTTITFPASANIQPFTTCFTVLLTIINGVLGDSNAAISLQFVSPTQFGVYGGTRTAIGSGAILFSYLAIGY